MYRRTQKQPGKNSWGDIHLENESDES